MTGAALGLMLAVGSPLMAQTRWVRIGDTTRTPSIDLDTSQIKGGKPHIHLVWTRVTFSPPKVVNGHTVVSDLSQDVYDCSKGQTLSVRDATYDADGNVVSSGDHTKDYGPLQWQEPFPDSVLELQIRSVCHYFGEAGY